MNANIHTEHRAFPDTSNNQKVQRQKDKPKKFSKPRSTKRL